MRASRERARRKSRKRFFAWKRALNRKIDRVFRLRATALESGAIQEKFR